MSTVFCEQTNSSIPNQSHSLIMVPRLPGSRMSSRTRISPFCFIGVGWGILKTARHEFAVVSAVIFSSSFWVIMVYLLVGICGKSDSVEYKCSSSKLDCNNS